MPLSKDQKGEVLAHLEKQMGCMKGMVLLDYKGVTANDIKLLRVNAQKEGVEYKVCKKTLLAKALQKANIDLDPKKLEGQIAYAMSCDDEIISAKTVTNFAKTNKAIRILAGVLEGNVLSAEAVQNLAKLPGKQELRGQLAGTLNAPISGFVNVLAGNLKGLVRVLGAIKEARGKASA